MINFVKLEEVLEVNEQAEMVWEKVNNFISHLNKNQLN